MPHPRLRSAVLILAVLASLPACQKRSRPNVLLVTIDTLRADHLGCYGFRPARTPNIDRLAAEGVRCDNAVSAAPITMPAHSSILTGLYPPAHGVRDNGAYALGDDVVTLPERLAPQGYATQAFVSAVVLSRRYNLTQGFESYDDDLWAEDEPKLFMIRDRPAARTADRVLAWLDKWEATPSRRPFFTWVHFFDPHQPYEPSAPDAAGAASPYDGEITSADRGVGRIVEALRSKGLLDDTLVVLTADHGESLGEHQEKTHAIFIYDATVHVPLVWRYPQALPRGARLPRFGAQRRHRADHPRGPRPPRGPGDAGAGPLPGPAGQGPRSRPPPVLGVAPLGGGVRDGAPARDPLGREQVDPGPAPRAVRPAARPGRAPQPLPAGRAPRATSSTASSSGSSTRASAAPSRPRTTP